MDNSTTFTNRMTVRAYESKHQCKIHVCPHKTKEGIYLYYHSDAEDASAIGLVSQRAVDLLSVEGDSAWDKLMIADCHYIDNTGKQQTCKMLMLSNLKMNTKAYPLISEYVEAIKLAEDNLEQLSYLKPVLDSDGSPIMSSGNFAVVFKMKDERNGKFYALKCFIKDQEGRDEAYKQIADELELVSSEFIIPIMFFEKELFVDTSNSDETEFPVLLMDWVEGVTLDKYVRMHLQDQHSLQLISYQFCRLAAWLMAQPFAHGDLKPDNILVKDDGSLVLVDYDGMFVPAMKGQKAREVGSPDYRHPARSINDFNESIDDFSLATIAMQLYAIALRPDLLTTTAGDTLLLCEKDYRNLEKSEMMTELFSQVGNPEFEKLIAIFLLAHSEMSLSKLSFRIFNINKPSKKNRPTLISTEVTDEDLAGGIKDEYGVIYSHDWNRLLSVPENISSLVIKQGTKVIGDRAFWIFMGRVDITCIIIPKTVTHIGKNAFDGCVSLSNLLIPNSVTHIDNGAFSCCTGLNSVIIPKSVMFIGTGIFHGCSRLRSIKVYDSNQVYDSRDNCNAVIHTKTNTLIAGCSATHIPNSILHIGERAFWECHGLNSIVIPNSVKSVDNEAFLECDGLTSITLPNSVSYIGSSAFAWCKGLTSIFIPDSVTFIANNAFDGCGGLSNIVVSKNNPIYDSRDNCNAIIDTHTNTLLLGCVNTSIPHSITYIGNNAFDGCDNLTSITIPDSVTSIGDGAFQGCSGITSIALPESVTHIGNEAFKFCIKIKSLFIPKGIIHIGLDAFLGCDDLSSIKVSRNNQVYDSRDNCNAIIHTETNTLITGCSNTNIPSSIKKIGDFAFYGCDSLANISIPNSVTCIGDGAFEECNSLMDITIPGSVTHIGDRAFDGCVSLLSITIPKGSINKFKELITNESIHKLLVEK